MHTIHCSPAFGGVKLLSISQLFLLCIRASVAPLRYEPRRCVLVVPQCFAAPQNFKRIVGLRIGLLGFYRGGALIATEYFTGEIGVRSGTDGKDAGTPTTTLPLIIN